MLRVFFAVYLAVAVGGIGLAAWAETPVALSAR